MFAIHIVLTYAARIIMRISSVRSVVTNTKYPVESESKNLYVSVPCY